jgi:hypothetical protein
LYVFAFFLGQAKSFALSLPCHLQLLLPKSTDDTSSGESPHSHGLRHGFHRRNAITNSKDAAHVGFVERGTCLDEALLVYTQSELLSKRPIKGFMPRPEP